MNNTLIVGILMLLVGVGLGYGYSRSTPIAEKGMGMHRMGDGSMMGQNIDQHFIVQMIPHHQGAIDMAKVALEKSKRPEILSLANGIIEAQTREITDMTAWYTSWFGSAPQTGGIGPMGGMHMDGMTGDLTTLQVVGAADFDREFIDQMIPHHEMAVMMASMLQASTERAEMKQLADDIITSQTREIEMMRSWRSAWYK